MKNQYVGDINDYHKYGLLRILTDFGRLRLAVCWMLTEDDTRTDGRKTSYLHKLTEFSHHDPDLFHALHSIVHKIQRRSVASIKSSPIFKNARYYSDLLTDDVSSRDQWLSQLTKDAAQFDLIFFDPDNGLEIKSVSRGKKNSCKFLYCQEIAALAHVPASFLIYQHFPREKRDVYTRRRAAELRAITGRRVSSFQTGNVVFFLLQPPAGDCHFARTKPLLAAQWKKRFKLSIH